MIIERIKRNGNNEELIQKIEKAINDGRIKAL